MTKKLFIICYLTTSLLAKGEVDTLTRKLEEIERSIATGKVSPSAIIYLESGRHLFFRHFESLDPDTQKLFKMRFPNITAITLLRGISTGNASYGDRFA